MNAFRSMLSNEDGASLVEYALIIAFVAGIAAAAFKGVGTKLSGLGNATATMVQNGTTALTNT